MAIKRVDKRRKTQRLDLTGLRGKLIKFVTPNLSDYGGHRRSLESRKVPHLRHLLEWVLDAPAGK